MKLDTLWHWSIPYSETLKCQIERRENILIKEDLEALIFAEHLPTITLGKRGGQVHNVPDDTSLHQINRGGMATWHGPGQLVLYPIINLRKRNIGIRTFICILEGSIFDVLKHFGLSGYRQDQPGIWINQQKVAALGLDVRKGVSIHGASLNVRVDPSRFQSIDPCGTSGMQITSLDQQLGSVPNLCTIGQIWRSFFLERLNSDTL